MKALILGGGVAGCTTAHLLARDGWQVRLIEKEPYLGGGCRTFFHCDHPFTWGPRLYYGYSGKIFDWVNAIVPIRRFPFELKTLAHEPLGKDRQFWTYPPHELDLEAYPRSAAILKELACRDSPNPPANFDEYYRQRVGPTLYDMFTDHYSKKMWMIDDNRVFDIFDWSAKDNPIESGTREAYKGSYLGYPFATDGYNGYFERMTEGVQVLTGTRLCRTTDALRRGMFQGWDFGDADVIVNTTPIDEFCGQALGELPYVGREFHLLVLPCKEVFPGDVRFCHYASADDEWTRVTEFKKITFHESDSTLLVMEKPSRANKLYPYLTHANVAKARKYLDSLPGNIYSIGRLGTYKYSTIEQTIAQAFECAARITGKPNPMKGEFHAIGDKSLVTRKCEVC